MILLNITFSKIAFNLLVLFVFALAIFVLYLSYKIFIKVYGGRKLQEALLRYPELKDLPSPLVRDHITFKYSLPSPMEVEFNLLDPKMNIVKTIHSDASELEGEYQIAFDSKEMKNGIYFYQLKTPYKVSSKKMIIKNV